jgi:hypothetical protein
MARHGKPAPRVKARASGNIVAGAADGRKDKSAHGLNQPRNAGGATVLDFPGGAHVEFETTRDEWRRSPCGGWGSFPARPPGSGWVLVSTSHDKHSMWRRAIEGPRA